MSLYVLAIHLGGTISLSPNSVGPFIVYERTNYSVALTLIRTGAIDC